MSNALNFFELFVTDVKRAQTFYETVLEQPMRAEVFNGEDSAIFLVDGVAGALVKRPTRGPSPQGTLVYLNCDAKLDACLSRVAKAGGKVLMPKTDIGNPGFIAIIADPDGNQVGLHSERH